MKNKTHAEKIEQEKAEQLRMNCLEKAQHIAGYNGAPVSEIVAQAKRIQSFIKTGK